MPSICPKCGFNSSDPENCLKCGINFEGYKHFLEHHKAESTQWATRNSTKLQTREAEIAKIAPPSDPKQNPLNPFLKSGPGGLEFLNTTGVLYVKQQEDAFRIVTGWQTLNHYNIVSEDGTILGQLAERDRGVLSRWFFKDRRPLQIDIYDSQGTLVAEIWRPWFFIFSQLFIYSAGRTKLYGVVKRRWSWWLPQYDLCKGLGAIFAHLKCPAFGTSDMGGFLVGNRDYEIYDRSGRKTSSAIIRKLNGIIQRIFTDEDTYCVQMPDPWTFDEKLIILCAAISIDFDSFERPKSLIGRGSGFSLFGFNAFGGGNSNNNNN
jgi:hypothetical protein